MDIGAKNAENLISADEAIDPVCGVREREPIKRGEYTCSMHPEIRQSHAGSCPKCGMALEPVAPIEPASKTEYVCPMHPQIVRAEPGSCPICGMALEPRVV